VEIMDLLTLRKFAEDLTRNTGQILLEHQKNLKIVKQKDIRDVATNADIDSEKFIIDKIQKSYPDHSIFSEEKGEIIKNPKYKWIIDPLDGTKAYIRNLPNYSCNICLTEKEIPIVSVVYCPSFGKIYSAAGGLGAFINGLPAQLSGITDLSKSYVYFYLPTKNRKVINYDDSWKKIKLVADKVYRVESEASVSLALCFLCDGAMEAYINLSNPPHRHDFLPGYLIAKEAGVIIDSKKYPVVACNNQKIYNELNNII